VMAQIKTRFEADRKDPKIKEYSELLFDLAIIGEGGKIDNPSRFSRQVGELMSGALEG